MLLNCFSYTRPLQMYWNSILQIHIQIFSHTTDLIHMFNLRFIQRTCKTYLNERKTTKYRSTSTFLFSKQDEAIWISNFILINDFECMENGLHKLYWLFHKQTKIQSIDTFHEHENSTNIRCTSKNMRSVVIFVNDIVL